MIAVYLNGVPYWFNFPHTLESQEMLIHRLECEAFEWASIDDRIFIVQENLKRNLATVGRRYKTSLDEAARGFAAFGRAAQKLNLR